MKKKYYWIIGIVIVILFITLFLIFTEGLLCFSDSQCKALGFEMCVPYYGSKIGTCMSFAHPGGPKITPLSEIVSYCYFPEWTNGPHFKCNFVKLHANTSELDLNLSWIENLSPEVEVAYINVTGIKCITNYSYLKQEKADFYGGPVLYGTGGDGILETEVKIEPQGNAYVANSQNDNIKVFCRDNSGNIPENTSKGNLYQGWLFLNYSYFLKERPGVPGVSIEMDAHIIAKYE